MKSSISEFENNDTNDIFLIYLDSGDKFRFEPFVVIDGLSGFDSFAVFFNGAVPSVWVLSRRVVAPDAHVLKMY